MDGSLEFLHTAMRLGLWSTIGLAVFCLLAFVLSRAIEAPLAFFFSISAVGAVAGTAMRYKTVGEFFDRLVTPRALDQSYLGHQRAIVQRLAPPRCHVPLFSARFPRDEAKGWLWLMTLPGETLFSSWSAKLYRGVLWTILFVGFALIGIMMITEGKNMFRTLFSGSPGVGESSRGGTLFLFGLMVVMMLVLMAVVSIPLFIVGLSHQLILLSLPLVLRAHRLGYGGERLFDNWLAKIQAHARAAACGGFLAEVTEYMPAFKAPWWWPVLAHSWIYRQEGVVEEVAKWIEEKEKAALGVVA